MDLATVTLWNETVPFHHEHVDRGARVTPTETGTRPRVAGERELEILDATLDVLDEVGYDLLVPEPAGYDELGHG